MIGGSGQEGALQHLSPPQDSDDSGQLHSTHLSTSSVAQQARQSSMSPQYPPVAAMPAAYKLTAPAVPRAHPATIGHRPSVAGLVPEHIRQQAALELVQASQLRSRQAACTRGTPEPRPRPPEQSSAVASPAEGGEAPARQYKRPRLRSRRRIVRNSSRFEPHHCISSPCALLLWSAHQACSKLVALSAHSSRHPEYTLLLTSQSCPC